MRRKIKVLMLAWMTPGGANSRLRAGIAAGALLVTLLFPRAPSAAPGQIPLPGLAPAAAATNLAISSARTIEVRLAEARTNLSTFIAPGGAGNAPAGVSPQDVSLLRALLQRLVRLYEQQLSNAAELEAAKARREEAIREAQGWSRFAEPPPYSILLIDRLREEIQAERLKISNGDESVTTLNALSEEQRAALADAEGRLRQINEQLEGAKDPAVAARFSWQRDLERLRSQVAAASAGVLNSEREVRQEGLAGSGIRLGLLQRQLVIADAGAQFTQADLDKVTALLDRERLQLEGELAEAQTRRDAAARALESARQDLRLAQDNPAATPAARAPGVELVATREAQMITMETAISILRKLLEGGSIERAMWEVRFSAYKSRSVETLRESERRLRGFTHRLELWRDHARQQLDVSSSQIQLQETYLNDLDPGSDLRPLAAERLAALRERDQLHLRFVRAIERVHHLTERLSEGLRAAEGKLPITGRARNLFSDARSFLGRLWNFEVFTAEDTITVDGQAITGKRSITIGKIVLAILILVVGYWITDLIARLVEGLIVKRLKIEANQARLIRRWLRASLVFCLVLFSLVMVKIPLTVFAFAGGALAIALGFGMQTILKNFVSGLIILFERPFRVGDVLDVGGQRGTMTSIGLRASILQLWDGTETLIPNSALLENNLTNWTYTDRRVRFAISVGVAYGSDPRRVIQVMSEAAERHGLVEKEPKPQVLFTEFGDSSLHFELRFWADVSQTNSAQVSSDLRLMLASTFAEHGIVISYPQRELHLHAAQPIRVEVLPPENGQSGNVTGADPPAPGANNRGL
jgi:potassium efflux system protein